MAFVVIEDCTRIDAYSMQHVFRRTKAVNQTLRYTITCGEHVSMHMYVDMERETITLAYQCNGVKYSPVVPLKRVRSNLNSQHHYWLFTCPETGRACSKLYLYGARWVCRAAIPHSMYRQQTESRKQRTSGVRIWIGAIEASESVYPKHGKKTYKGKQTRHHARWERWQNKIGAKVVSLMSDEIQPPNFGIS